MPNVPLLSKIPMPTWLRRSWLPVLALLTALSCGEDSAVLAPAPARDQATPVDVQQGILPGLPIVDDLFDFATDGVLQFVQVPDLLHRHTSKLIRASQGGFVELNGFRVDIPAGALTRDTYVTITLPSTLPEALYVVADFGPTGTTFRRPVQVTLPLAGVRLDGADLSDLNVSFWNGTSWESYGGTATSTSITAPTSHFSTYGARRSGTDTASGG